MRMILVLLLLAATAVECKKKKNNTLCDICLDFVNTVDKALQHGDDVKEAVHNFCKSLPEFVEPACEKIIASSLDTIIDALKDHKSANEICTNLKFC